MPLAPHEDAAPQAKRQHSRIRTSAFALTTLIASLLPLLVAAPAEAASARISLSSPVKVSHGTTTVTLKASTTGRFTGKLRIQVRKGGTWRTVARTKPKQRVRTGVKLTKLPSRVRVVGTVHGTQRTVRSRSVVVRARKATPTPSTPLAAARAQILADTNAVRAKAGLRPLKPMPALDSVAQAWTNRMASSNKMMHNPSYYRQYPDGWRRAGENVAYGFGPKRVVAAWRDSPPHLANMRGDFTHIGIGWVVDSSGIGWFTQDFAKY